MKILKLINGGGAVAVLTLICICSCKNDTADGAQAEVKTNFQTLWPWRPQTDVRADGVMVYGAGKDFESRVQSWREHGYTVQFMTGIAWGEYQDYFYGEWDGKMHLDEAQVEHSGDTLWHSPKVPYLVPTDNFIRYFKECHIKKAIDNGIRDIVLEEPEFWATGGYSDAFKREWEKFYGFPWMPQDESPRNAYLSSKLKYYLFFNAIDDVSAFIKEYGKKKGIDTRCFIATHSLVNYSQWRIVSPEASLASLPSIDGYIAQVWTGTARPENWYSGVKKERVFETAFLEYGCMESMTSPTGRTVYFLTDPIEDGVRDWKDYKRNYQATFTAQLLYPAIDRFEVMPWPDRIYLGKYRMSANSDEQTSIPEDYATQMQLMVNVLGRMPATDGKVDGTSGVGVLMANSLMFQRLPEFGESADPAFSDFYGQAMPLLKRGVPVRIVHIENLGHPEATEGIMALLMTYSNMKPVSPEAHVHLAEWVRGGGCLIYSGRDDDPYQSVDEWWNSNEYRFDGPSDHLLGELGIESGAAEDIYSCGLGKVCILRHNPCEYILYKNGDKPLLDALCSLYTNGLQFKNHLYLERGAYDIAAVLSESVSDTPLTITGTLVDIYDHNLPVMTEKKVPVGEQALLLDIDRIADRNRPQVLAAASREYEEKWDANSYSYLCKSPASTMNVARVLLPSKPVEVTVDGNDVTGKCEWDDPSHTLLLRHPNSPDGVRVEFRW